MHSSGLDVSRETLERLHQFEALVRKWTGKINLIAPSTVEDIWERHILDSAQLLELSPTFSSWVDLGSGGGFPGVIVSIMVSQHAPTSHVTLVESDQRKATFLRTAIRELSLNATVHAERVMEISPMQADVLSARALANLDTLLCYADQHLASKGTALFPKGKGWEQEVLDAQKRWSFTYEAHRSRTSPEAAVLQIKDIQRV